MFKGETMKKIFLLVLSALLMLTAGCADVSDKSDDLGTDPFLNTDDTYDPEYNPDRDILMQLSHGGLDCSVNRGEPVEYNGEPVTIPVTLKARPVEEVSFSAGISCTINGVPQKLSTDGDKDKTVIIKTDLAPQETIEFEITLDPAVLAEDADKEQLPISFTLYFNAAYVPTENYPAFGNTHNAGWIPSSYIKFNTKPVNIVSPQAEGEYNEELFTDEVKKKYDITDSSAPVILQNGAPAGVLRTDDNGELSFTLLCCNRKAGKYRIHVLKNDMLATFNGGKEYAEVEIKEGYIYTLDFNMDNVQRGDVIQCVAQASDYDADYGPAYFFAPTPGLVVNSDFTFSTGPCETVLPVTDEPQGNEVPDDNIIHDDYYTVLGYIGEDPRLAVLADGTGTKLHLYDIDKGESTAVLDTTDYSITNIHGNITDDDGFGGSRMPDSYTELQWLLGYYLLDEYIAVPKVIVKNDETIYCGFVFFDTDLKVAKEVEVSEEQYWITCFTDDAEHRIELELQGDANNIVQAVYISDIDGNNRRKICELPANKMLFKESIITDNGVLYGNIVDYTAQSGDAQACVIDLESGRIQTHDKSYASNQNGHIYSGGDYVLYSTGKVFDRSSDSGVIVVYNRADKEFTEIETLHINESFNSTITPDGSRIVSYAAVYHSDYDYDRSIRIYDTSDGKLISSTELESGGINKAIPICSNEKIFMQYADEGEFYFEELL